MGHPAARGWGTGCVGDAVSLFDGHFTRLLKIQKSEPESRAAAYYAATRLRGLSVGDLQVDTGFPASDVIVLVPELMGEATRRGDGLDREAIFGAA